MFQGRGADAIGKGSSWSFYIWIQGVRAEKDVGKEEEKGGGKKVKKVRKSGGRRGKSLHLYVSTREKCQTHKANERETNRREEGMITTKMRIFNQNQDNNNK